MKVSLHHTELKVFIRCINSLGKLGHEIYFDWSSDGLVLKTVNSSRSAYAAVAFKPAFFEKVAHMASDPVTRFKIPSRSCCNVFKLSASLEKAVNKCRLMLSSGDTVFVVQFFCRYGVVKTYNMSIVDCEHLEAVYSLEQSANRLVITTKVLSEVLNNFRQSSEEITVLLKDGECIFQNYILQGDHNQILTQLPLSASEFDAYLVGCVSELTFCQRELRALLTFCELISPVVRIYCDRPGRPIIFACAHETRLDASFVLATLPPDAYSASDSQRSQSVQPHPLASKTPVQINRVSQPSTTVNISSVAHSVLPEFNNDVAGDEITLLATLPPAVHDGPLKEVSLFPVIENKGDITHTQLLPPMSSPKVSVPPRPFSVPRLRQSISSPLQIEKTVVAAPPPKKARSVLFSHLEQNEDSDPEQISAEALDLELQQLTRCYDDLDQRQTRHSTAITPGRTILVADSDED
ncbi:hypothetical protein CRM22_007603 [Opisthorchis felineus]|uniref:Cell cycle checkpoint control protein RAD9A n=1 Tax=Opisthorchis felineus TaxID=147828 RepID=A0A4V3SDV7_OPIFE|nr:hypothetical protein CRM22_007603 [Opisthorchis felineus]